MKKLPDNVACQRYLIRQKKYRKNVKHITLSTILFKIDNRDLSLVTELAYNIKTGNITTGHDFRYKNKRMLSRSKPKSKCNAETIMRALQENRKLSAKYNKYVIKKKQITTPVLEMDDIRLSLNIRIIYNTITHKIGIYNFLSYKGVRI